MVELICLVADAVDVLVEGEANLCIVGKIGINARVEWLN